MPSAKRIMQGRKAFTINRERSIDFSGVTGQIDHTGIGGDGALRVAAAWIANTTIADEVSSLVYKIVQRDDVSRRPVQPDQLRALWDRPNPDQVGMTWMGTNSLSLTLHGASYNALGWTNGGVLDVMWPIDALNVTLERLDGGGVRLTSPGQGDLTNLPGVRPEFMMVPLYMLPGHLTPISPVRHAAELLGLAAQYDATAAALARRGFNPAVVLTTDEPVEDAEAERLSTRLEKKHGGGANAGKVAVLGGKNIKLERMTMSMVDAQFIAQKADVFNLVMALWRVPPTVAGMVDKPSTWGSGVAEFSRGLERFTLRPIVRRFEAAFEACLTRWVDESLQVRFKFDSMLSASPKDRVEIQRLALMNGMTSTERILAQNDEPPFGGEETVYSALSQATDEDREIDRLKRRGDAAAALVRAGYTPEQALAAVQLPAPGNQ